MNFRQTISKTLCTSFLMTCSGTALAAASVIGPHDAQLCYQEAMMGQSWSDPDACTRAIRHGDLTRRDMAATYSNRGILNGKRGSVERALRDHNEAISLDASSSYALINRANLLTRMQRYEDALSDYQRAIEMSEEPWAVPYFNRALLHLRMGQKSAAREDLRKAKEIEPESTKYQELLSTLASQKGDNG